MSGLTWAIGLAVTIGLIATVVAVALRHKAERRASLLGIATGATFGLTAALMKGMTLAYQHGIVGVLTAWQTYATITGGLAGMFLMQNALQAGRLIAAQPGITLVDPAVAILWGLLAFREPTQSGVLLVLAILSGALVAVGAVVLARSPSLEEDAPAEGKSGEGGDTGEDAREPSEPAPAAG